MKLTLLVSALLGLCAVPHLNPVVTGVKASAQSQLIVVTINRLKVARTGETIELTMKDLAALAEKDLMKLHVRDSSGTEVLSQSVDTDYDDYHKPDTLIFQSDYAAGETKTFTITAGAKREYKKDDFRAYGRFVRERFDDFAWENDRIAHRTYGKALIAWKGEPLTSSAIDIWSKRTEKLVINDWYMVDNYHADQGEGVDAYSAGPTRGCGGSGIWANNQLFIPTNFIDSRVLANGPIRVMFELDYEPLVVSGVKVSHTLRVSLDAGSQLNRFQASYQAGEPLAMAIGLKKVKDEQNDINLELGRLASWQPMEKNLGMQGLGVLVNPSQIDKFAADTRNNLLVMKARSEFPVSYWAGFAWDRAGRIISAEAWKKYLDDFVERLRSPIEVTVK